MDYIKGKTCKNMKGDYMHTNFDKGDKPIYFTQEWILPRNANSPVKLFIVSWVKVLKFKNPEIQVSKS